MKPYHETSRRRDAGRALQAPKKINLTRPSRDLTFEKRDENPPIFEKLSMVFGGSLSPAASGTNSRSTSGNGIVFITFTCAGRRKESSPISLPAMPNNTETTASRSSTPASSRFTRTLAAMGNRLRSGDLERARAAETQRSTPASTLRARLWRCCCVRATSMSRSPRARCWATLLESSYLETEATTTTRCASTSRAGAVWRSSPASPTGKCNRLISLRSAGSAGWWKTSSRGSSDTAASTHAMIVLPKPSWLS